MKKSILVLIVLLCAASPLAQAAVNVKKAAPVSTKKVDAVETTTSLLPGVINLVSNVKTLNAQQQQLTAECEPTSDEINTVNNLVKEWAKIGTIDAFNSVAGLGDKCPGTYEDFMLYSDNNEACYETFTDADMVWKDFPKASVAKKCDLNTNKKCSTISNIYDVFARISFDNEDYTVSELNKVVKLREKAEKCAPAKLNAAKREMYGGLVVQTLGSIGATSGAAGTSSVLDAVSSMGGSGDVKNMLPSLGQMATQFLDK